jgi:uncharacterized membrane protein
MPASDIFAPLTMMLALKMLLEGTRHMTFDVCNLSVFGRVWLIAFQFWGDLGLLAAGVLLLTCLSAAAELHAPRRTPSQFARLAESTGSETTASTSAETFVEAERRRQRTEVANTVPLAAFI